MGEVYCRSYDQVDYKRLMGEWEKRQQSIGRGMRVRTKVEGYKLSAFLAWLPLPYQQ